MIVTRLAYITPALPDSRIVQLTSGGPTNHASRDRSADETRATDPGPCPQEARPTSLPGTGVRERRS
jgi:hypothetical protein